MIPIISLDSDVCAEGLSILRKHTDNFFRFIMRAVANNAANKAYNFPN